MKKTLLVAALAAMLLFAVAGSAFAAGINHSGQDRLGGSLTAPASVPAWVDGNGVSHAASSSVAGAGTNTYLDWDKSLGANAANGNSPHGNYTTTTVKCVVCHAVHYAGANGGPVQAGSTPAAGQADTLLRMRADQACVYCHATDGMAVNGRPVYNGVGGLIDLTAPGNSGGATNVGHITGANCSYCHTNVHGANADHSVASLDGFLLKKMSVTNVQGLAPSTDMIGAITAIDHKAVNQGFAPGDALAGSIGAYATTNNATLREQAVGVFCAECHNGAYATGAAGAATNINSSSDGVTAFSGHRIAASATTTWNADGTKSSSMLASNQAVAWAAANNCKSCHDAVDVYGNAAFPHAWGQASVAVPAPTKMWLLSAADSGSGTTKTALGGTPANQYDTTKVQLSDGVCLKCHVASGGTAGVGITF